MRQTFTLIRIITKNVYIILGPILLPNEVPSFESCDFVFSFEARSCSDFAVHDMVLEYLSET